MNSKLLLIVAGVLAIACAWLPWASVQILTEKTTMTGFQGEMKGNPGLIPVILGALMAVMGLVGKKWSYIVAILLALCTLGLGIKHYMDVTSVSEYGATVGYGLYVMMAAGVIGIVGGAMGMKGPKKTAA